MSKQRNADAVSMKEAIDRYLKAMGIDQKVHETAVLSKWGELMGEAVEKRTERIHIDEGILYIELNSSVMRDELMQSRSRIVEAINELAGFEMIHDVYFK